MPGPSSSRSLCWFLLVWLWMPWQGMAQTKTSPSGTLNVFAAASLTEAFKEIAQALEKHYPGLRIVYNFAGSQALRTQIEQGAQADIFASADGRQMEQARQNGVTQGETPIFVKNRLVVIVPHDNPAGIQTFQDLARPGMKLDLAAAQVPVGNYSREAIEKASAAYGADFATQVRQNIVSEENNVKQVVLKVQLGEVDAGIVYISDVILQVRQAIHTIPIPDAYNRIATYPIAITKDVKNRLAAEAFIAFVLSEPGQAILKAHNFLSIND